jgi:hypothetical protein
MRGPAAIMSSAALKKEYLRHAAFNAEQLDAVYVEVKKPRIKEKSRSVAAGPPAEDHMTRPGQLARARCSENLVMLRCHSRAGCSSRFLRQEPSCFNEARG